jgi:alpha-mannosidase
MTPKELQIYIRRVQRFADRLADMILADYTPFSIEYFKNPTHLSYEEAIGQQTQPIVEGENWGQAWDSAWFRLVGEIPETWKGKAVAAQLDFSGEGLVFGPEGRILQGISNGSVFKHDFNRDLVRLHDTCPGRADVLLRVEATASSLFGVITDPDPAVNSPQRYGWFDARINRARLCVFDTELWHLWLDLRIVNGFIKTLPETGERRGALIRCANEAIDAFGENRKNASRSREILQRVLGKPASASDLTVWAVGHAHLDTAWLWTVAETVRKSGRTFASQLALLDKYPGYVFGASQPQQYAFVKERYPALYEQIKKMVAAGRWELQGGMWVEADCNIPSGESLVRQILHGKNFFRDEFGVEVDNLWLPDAFGFTAALPQIMLKSGLKYFMSQKISWNQVNEFPYHTFLWQGLDGSEVIAHFLPENNYNSMLGTDCLVPAQAAFKEKDFIDGFLCLFGVGDGGGGPKEENVELGLRMKDLEGAPRIRFAPAREFFKGLERYRDKLSVWSGDLYLELHRGTFTTQAQVKKSNRRLENKLRSLEMLLSCLPIAEYPAREMDVIWKKLLLNQFHDIIPGSSITKVYEVTHTEHEYLLSRCDELSADAAGKLFTKDDKSIVLFNSLPETFTRPIVMAKKGEEYGLVDEAGKSIPTQVEKNRLLIRASIPPYSFLILNKVPKGKTVTHAQGGLVLENDLVRYEFDRDAALCSGRDKELDRDIIMPGQKGNVFSLYADFPNDWDAWDIDIFYENNQLDTARGIVLEKIVAGPVRQYFCLILKIGQSVIEQTISLAPDSKRLDFETMVNWGEKHRMLRVGFYVNVRADHATLDTQYGYIRRSTRRATSWEKAQFEVPVYRYADLSDVDYGVALLNDAKYGMRIHENLLDLNLLRSTTYPDPDADQGLHQFTYSLYPHKGGFAGSRVISEAAQLNQGVQVFDNLTAETKDLPWRVEGEGLSLEVVKKAEKEDCRILRIVETAGRISKGQLVIKNKNTRLVETDLMEWTEGKATECGQPLPLELKPFEIRTYKLYENG